MRCDISEHSYEAPRNPKGTCDFGDWGHAIVMNGGGIPKFACISDTVAGPGLPVLEYGRTSVVGVFACGSGQNGMSCTDIDTGHTFRLAKASYDLG